MPSCRAKEPSISPVETTQSWGSECLHGLLQKEPHQKTDNEEQWRGWYWTVGPGTELAVTLAHHPQRHTQVQIMSASSFSNLYSSSSSSSISIVQWISNKYQFVKLYFKCEIQWTWPCTMNMYMIHKAYIGSINTFSGLLWWSRLGQLYQNMTVSCTDICRICARPVVEAWM